MSSFQGIEKKFPWKKTSLVQSEFKESVSESLSFELGHGSPYFLLPLLRPENLEVKFRVKSEERALKQMVVFPPHFHVISIPDISLSISFSSILHPQQPNTNPVVLVERELVEREHRVVSLSCTRPYKPILPAILPTLSKPWGSFQNPILVLKSFPPYVHS